MGAPRAECVHGDPFCPCPDGLACHYAWAGDTPPAPCPRTGIVGCTACAPLTLEECPATGCTAIYPAYAIYRDFHGEHCPDTGTQHG